MRFEDYNIFDAEFRALYRCKFLCIFLFKPSTTREKALRRVNDLMKLVAAAEGHLVSWVAAVAETSCEGPIIYVCIAGVRARFREQIRGFNRSSAHCHVVHSELRGGGTHSNLNTDQNTEATYFWKVFENSQDRVVGGLGFSGLRKSAASQPVWLQAQLRVHARRNSARVQQKPY
jgi:hypothetical protein